MKRLHRKYDLEGLFGLELIVNRKQFDGWKKKKKISE